MREGWRKIRKLIEQTWILVILLTLFFVSCSTPPPKTHVDPVLASKAEFQQAVDASELVLGMDMKDVTAVLGTPHDIETAGEPRLGNQKWSYRTNLLSQSKLRPMRVVYFESGKVVGWENVTK